MTPENIFVLVLSGFWIYLAVKLRLVRLTHIKIQDETEDRTIINDVMGNRLGFFLIYTGIFQGGIFYYSWAVLHSMNLGWFIFVLVLSGFWIFLGISSTFISVIIDKKSQSIIIKTDSIIHLFKSVKKLPFSDINKIKIEGCVDDGNYIFTAVNLIDIQEGSTQIYDTYYESDAEIFAEKIRNITNKEIILNPNRLNGNKLLSRKNKQCPVKDCALIKSTYRGLARHIAIEGNNDSNNLHIQYKESKGILKQWKTGEEITRITDEIMKIEGWVDKEDLAKDE